MPASPKTAAGRALLAYIDYIHPGYKDENLDAIVAIEAEARDIAIAVTDSGEMAGWMQREEDAYQKGRAEAAQQAAPLDVRAACQRAVIRWMDQAGEDTDDHGAANLWDFVADEIAEYARPAQARPADAALRVGCYVKGWDADRILFEDVDEREHWIARAALAQQPTPAEEA